ncbi:WD40 repeat-like protein [Mycena sanguinolenta]|uniref:WD40 repeat-like protein n=1 Tax=Mycena sanguinolenta TaxID=230812 RepID=A0A8H7CYA7_9AGAR|nr:WD40 repeat-like protein [Mycena sanguinolenta]
MPRSSSKISAVNTRHVLAERTLNIPIPDAKSTLKSWFAPAQCKRPLDTDDRGSRKRVKISSDNDYSSDDAYESDSEPKISHSAASCHRRNTTPWNIAAQRHPVAASSRRPFRAVHTANPPILRDIQQIRRVSLSLCPRWIISGPAIRMFLFTLLVPSPACLVPVNLSVTVAARSGKTPFLAVATEQGTVYILNTSKRKEWDPEPVHVLLQPHNNGIFDVKWNTSDALLATCSGDRSVHISDVETRTVIRALHGHEGTVKCASWDPSHPDLLSTGGRDGLVCIWDLRVSENRPGQETASLHPVLNIPAVHEDLGAHAKRKTPKGKKPKSVTGLLFSDANPYHLITSGSSDGNLRCWDVRVSQRTRSSKIKEPACLLSSPLDPTHSQGPRPRGIVSLVSGTGPSTGLLFALSTDARIHTYGRDSLAAFGTTYTHANLQTNFYVKLATSPCGRWLASGGAGAFGSSFMFDISNATRAAADQIGVELKGHSGDAGVVDWAQEMLSTCWDDGMVRVWRPDVETYRACVENPEEKRWDWCWSSM